LDFVANDPLKREAIQATDIEFLGPAPHSKLAAHFLGILAAITPETWDKDFLDMTTELLKTPDIDPVLRLRLLSELLATASAGSYPLAKALAPQVAKLAALKRTVLDADWFHPDDSEVGVSRDLGKATLKSIPAIATIKQQAFVTWKQLAVPIDTRYQWNGRILLDRTGIPTIAFKPTALPTGDGTLYILSPPSPNRKGTFQLIGQWNNGQFKLEPASRQQLLGGIPVYFHPKSSPTDSPTP